MPAAVMRFGASVLAGLLALPAGLIAEEPALKAPLSADLRFVSPDGAVLGQVLPEQAFDVVLQFRSELGSVPTDLQPMAWLRDRSPSDLPCGESAAAFRAAGRASIGSVDLNGVVLGVVMQDGSVTMLDPERSLGTANLISARQFQPPPSALAADPVTGQFLLALPGDGMADGQVLAMSPYGQTRVLADKLDHPATLIPSVSGGGWLLEQGTGDVLRIGAGDGPDRFELQARQITGDADTEGSERIAVLSPDRLTVLQADGRIALQAPAQGALAVGLTPEAALWLAPGTLHVIWLDAPDQPLTVPLAGDFDRIAASPEGRMVYLFAHDRTGFGVVDLALGRMVQGVGTDSPVAEIAFLPDTAMMRLADQSAVGVMDLREIEPNSEAAVGRVALGPPDLAARPDARLLAPLLPEPALLAVHADSYSGFVLNGTHAVSGKPPMEALRLRGGVPHLVRALERSLRQSDTEPGLFTAAAQLPRAGNWELVVSVGVGQLAFCAPVPTPPSPQADAISPGRIAAQPQPDGRLRLRFVAADGEPAADLSGTLDIATLTGNWRARAAFSTDSDGVTTDGYALGDRLPLVITTRGVTSPDHAAGFAPLVLEDIR